jgi:hypothetical protein
MKRGMLLNGPGVACFGVQIETKERSVKRQESNESRRSVVRNFLIAAFSGTAMWIAVTPVANAGCFGVCITVQKPRVDFSNPLQPVQPGAVTVGKGTVGPPPSPAIVPSHPQVNVEGNGALAGAANEVRTPGEITASPFARNRKANRGAGAQQEIQLFSRLSLIKLLRTSSTPSNTPMLVFPVGDSAAATACGTPMATMTMMMSRRNSVARRTSIVTPD